jgi:hypothetical protein
MPPTTTASQNLFLLGALRDKSIKSMPTDLVGKIYKSVDLDKPSTVKKALATWIKDDLARWVVCGHLSRRVRFVCGQLSDQRSS